MSEGAQAPRPPPAGRLRVLAALETTASGRELIARGDPDDVATAAALDVTDLAAELHAEEFLGS